MSNRAAFFAAGSFSLLLCLSAGCGSPSEYKRAEAKVENIQTVEKNLTDVKKQVGTVGASLQAISSSAADPRKAYDKFVADVSTLKSQRDTVRKNVDDMNARNKEYFEAWRNDLQQIRDADIRAKAEEKEQKAKERFNRIRTAGEQARDAYEPYVQTLEDIQKYLANSLNPEGIKTIQPNIDKAKASGAALVEKLDVVIAEIGSAAKAIAPASGAAGGSTPAGGTAPAPETSTKP